MTVTREQMTLAVLAGGEGSRMGAPKGSMQIAGDPILAYLLRQLAWPGPTMLITAPGREHPSGHELFDAEFTEVIARGPLGAVLTALENLRTPFLAVVTVDMPGIQSRQIIWIADQLNDQLETLGMMTF